MTRIALSFLFDKTKRITENKALTWNPIVFPVMSNNKYNKITKYKLLKIIKLIYTDNNLIFKGTPYTSKRSARTL